MKDFYFEYSQQMIDLADNEYHEKQVKEDNGLNKLIKQANTIKKQILSEGRNVRDQEYGPEEKPFI